MHNLQKFLQVFGSLPLTDKIKEVYKNCYVKSVHLIRESKTLSISLLFEEIEDQNFQIGESFIKEAFPYLNNVNISVSYNLKESDLNKVIQKFWNHIIYYYSSKSPILSQTLKSAKWYINKDVLFISVANSDLFDVSDITQFLNETLGVNIAVVFTDDAEQEYKKEQYFEYISNEETRLLREIQKNQSEHNEAQQSNKVTQKKEQNNNGFKRRRDTLKIVNQIKTNPVPLNTKLEEGEMTVKGQVFLVNNKEREDFNIVTFSIYDGKGSIEAKFFTNKSEIIKYDQILAIKNNVIVKGKAQYDKFTKEIVLMAKEICDCEANGRKDNSTKKRVELHLHTNMSQMDALTPVKDYINQAKDWGHAAIAITDHGVVQAFPEASQANGIKIIYGIEAYIVDDQSAIVSSPKKQSLKDEFVIFDIETTGLSRDVNKIIEIGAVKIKNGEQIDTFSTLIDPRVPLSEKIIELTNITDEMLIGQPTEEEIIPKFLEFCGDAVLVAHNASFDVGFIRVSANRILNKKLTNTVLDTVELSRLLLPNITNHKLNTVAEHFNITLENHHRAVDDATATANIFLKCSEILEGMGITTVEGINLYASQFIDTTKIRNHHHATILVADQNGLKHLYKLVSDSHVKYFFRNNRRPKFSRPRIPKGELSRLREGLLIGTACIKGELYSGILESKSEEELHTIADFYDFLEVQPSKNYAHLASEYNQNFNDINKKIIEIGDKCNKTVVATGDVHFINPEDDIYRKVILFGEGMGDFSPPFYFRTTEEMLQEFSFLGKEKAYEIVVTNTNKIADTIGDIIPIPKGTFPPSIKGSEEELRKIAYLNTVSIYGENMPSIVKDRLEMELNSIINNGFAVMYMAAHTLIKRSLENRYTVGSRGSVGSSFVATMANVTEVNPLPAHYLCKACKLSHFDTEDVANFIANNPGASGCDLPNKNCPNCETPMEKDGHDIPFETFLGFEGDKEPDIDLNFSGEYQQYAHDHAQELFGEGNVFKAGTISTIADKTAYGYTMKYLEQKNMRVSKAEVNRIKAGATGVKRTTGQHPGGLMVVPATHSIYDFTPIQRPANDIKTNVTTTHFDYRSISGRLLKLDLLGHDVPTIIRMLWDLTGVDPRTVPLSDEKVLSLFTGPIALNLSKDDIETGSLGIPEFGTGFVRSMLLDTKPKSFGELVRISGLSHGTDVWLNNAQSLIKNGTCVLKDVISTRDDIMVYLIAKGLEKKQAFNIMESVRKGRGLTKEWEEAMEGHNVPSWYIESCKKIKYMFPKGHAVAYVMMAVRIAYYKVYHPKSFYCAILSTRTRDFDYALMCKGKEKVTEEIERIKTLQEQTATERNILATLEIVNEIYLRDLIFAPLDIYKAEETKFIVTEEGLMAPLASISGLGETVARNIVEQREEGEFTSLEDFKERTKATKTIVELLVNQGVLKGLPEGRQLTLF